MADNIRATPQNPYTGALARGLRSLQQLAGQYQVDPRIPLLGGTSVDELLSLPGAASLAEDVSYYGPRALIRGGNVATGGIGTFRLDPRVADVADVATNVTPLAAMAGKTATRGAMAAGRAGERLAERVVPQVMERGGFGAQLMQDMATGSRSQVVKPKGGNWLVGSIEREIAPMRTVDPAMMDVLRNADPRFVDQAALNRVNAEGIALDKWLETKLAKYIKNEMGTAEDPIRALAEKGPIHSEILPTGYNVSRARREAGFPEGGMGVSPLAKTWEDRADTFINPLKASDLTGYYPEAVKENPWLLKVPPETPVYEMLQGSAGQGMLGFGHLVDELKNAINPTSGLPENLRWKYGDLDKVTVPQAVQRVSDINAWRAAQKAEADMARAMGPAAHVFKEYPEQGFKWVELKVPKETGKKVERTKSAEELEMAREGVETMSHDDIVAMTRDMARDEGIRPGTQEFNDMLQENIRMFGVKPSEVDESIRAFQDAVRYEGEQMGHSVAGYADEGSYGLGGLGAIKEGRAKIFSLRDKKGQPHVTIEVKPGVENPSITEGEFKGQRRFIVNNKGTGFPTIEEAQKYAQEISTPEIVQIKGKSNRAPKEEYLPAVQDFIRSGNWGKIGDLKNAGLVQLPDKRLITNEQFDEAIGRISDGGDRPTNEWFMNVMRGDPSWWDEMKGAFEGFSRGGHVRGYATGGLVGSNIYNSDAMQDPASAYRFADGGQAGDVRAYADGGLVANSHTADFDPARIDAIVGDLNALNAG